MKHVLVFTMDGCPHCSDFKEMLTNEGIEYIEADINENEEEYNLFVKVTENEFDRDFQELEEAITLIREQIA
jgi:glutaredoxin